MRRLAALGSLALAVGLLLARRRRRARPAPAPPVAPPPPAAALPPAPPRFRSVAWTFRDAPGEEAALAIRVGVPPGAELDRVDARETPTQVFVTALVREPAEAGGPSPPAGAPTETDATVPLSAPLGERELIHAAVDGDDSTPPPSLYP